MTDAEIDEGLRLDAERKRQDISHWEIGHNELEFMTFADEHFADALRELRRLRAEEQVWNHWMGGSAMSETPNTLDTLAEYIKTKQYKGPTSGPALVYYEHTDILEIYSCVSHDCFALPISVDFAWLCDMETRERVGMKLFGVSRHIKTHTTPDITQTRIAELTAALAELRERGDVLADFCYHTYACDHVPCTCGCNTALARWRELSPPTPPVQ